jgi:hypothetical protein
VTPREYFDQVAEQNALSAMECPGDVRLQLTHSKTERRSNDPGFKH